MNFWEGFSPLSFTIRALKLFLPTATNILLINFASARAMAQGDTDWMIAIILGLSMLGSISLLMESIKVARKLWIWQHAMNLLVCIFNVYYFFKTLICCVPMVGDW